MHLSTAADSGHQFRPDSQHPLWLLVTGWTFVLIDACHNSLTVDSGVSGVTMYL